MTCRVALCAVCRLAGLVGCPFQGAALPLAEAERPKVVYRGYLTNGPDGTVVWSKLDDPTDWGVS